MFTICNTYISPFLTVVIPWYGFILSNVPDGFVFDGISICICLSTSCGYIIGVSISSGINSFDSFSSNVVINACYTGHEDKQTINPSITNSSQQATMPY